MKKSYLFTAAIAMCTLATTTSCGDSFLQLDPAGSVSEGTLLTQEGIDMVLTGAYSSLNNMQQASGFLGGTTNYIFGDIAGGDANKGSTAGDQPDIAEIETFGTTAANSFVLAKWKAVYEGVKRCNNVLDMVQKAGDKVANATAIEAQARFIKAYWMFEGIKVFGAQIPYVDLESYQGSTDPQIGNVDENGNPIYIWKQVAEDFKFAADNLPETWGADKGRVNKWAAKAMLARLYQYWSSPFNGKNATENHWAECKSLIKDVIDNGVDTRGKKFELAKTYGDLFDVETSDWSGESIFDIQYTISGTETDTNSWVHSPLIAPPGGLKIGGWGFYCPSFSFVNSYLVDADGLPIDDFYGKPSVTVTDNSLPKVDLTAATDPRLDFCAGRFGVPYMDYGTPSPTKEGIGDWIRDYTNQGWYINKKPQPKLADRGSTSVSSTPSSTAKNYHIFRLADAYLMYAECCIQDGDLKTAREYINLVRGRAANGFVKDDTTDWNTATYTMDDLVNGKVVSGAAANYRIGLYTKDFASKEEAFKALERENRAEFGMDGHRWFDLARWGMLKEEMDKYGKFENSVLGSSKFQPYQTNAYTFPIPVTEINTAQGRLVQNENWK